MEDSGKFDIEAFCKGYFCVQCKTEGEARDFLNTIKDMGIVWYDDGSLDHTEWGAYREEMYYTAFVSIDGTICVSRGWVKYFNYYDHPGGIIRWGDVLMDDCKMEVCTPSELVDFING